MVLDSAQGVNAVSGATLFWKTVPCLSLTAITATMMARNRLENTQNAADGNVPSGECLVGVNSVVMMSSCM